MRLRDLWSYVPKDANGNLSPLPPKSYPQLEAENPFLWQTYLIWCGWQKGVPNECVPLSQRHLLDSERAQHLWQELSLARTEFDLALEKARVF